MRLRESIKGYYPLLFTGVMYGLLFFLLEKVAVGYLMVRSSVVVGDENLHLRLNPIDKEMHNIELAVRYMYASIAIINSVYILSLEKSNFLKTILMLFNILIPTGVIFFFSLT